MKEGFIKDYIHLNICPYDVLCSKEPFYDTLKKTGNFFKVIMFKIVGLDHIVLNTQQADTLINFYCKILGCVIERRQPDLHLTQLRAGENIIDIVEREAYSRTGSPNLEHFCLKINPFNYEDCINYFSQHGIQLYRYGERFGAQGKVHSFYVRDPDGNEIELCELKK